MSQPDHVVIVGGGLAAAHAVTTLREEGFTGALTLIGAERHLPYERPPLSKSYLAGKKSLADATVQDQQWYDDQSVTLRLGATATAIDLSARTVELDTSDPLGYDALLLATGAAPRVLDLPGAEAAAYLRTVEDSDALKAAFTAGGRAVLVGGGWIGLEVAAAARDADMDVTVLESAALPLGGVLGEQLAQYLTDLHRGHGVDIQTGVRVEAVETDDTGRPTGVRTSTGLHEADLVVIAVGAIPRTDLAAAAGLAVAEPGDGGGISVDTQLRTSDPQVWAAGDVALATHTTLGPLRVEHWDNAIRQGKAVAKSILGQDVAYDWQPYFYTDQFEFGMEYVGHGSPSDRVEVRGSLADNEFIAYWLDTDNRVTAAMNVNIWDVSDQLREIVGTTVDPGALTDLR